MEWENFEIVEDECTGERTGFDPRDLRLWTIVFEFIPKVVTYNLEILWE